MLFGPAPMKLEGRVAVVTGAAMGMGLEIALLLAKGGCSLALCDINEAELLKTKEQCAAVRLR